jgi:hypothetical protein
MIDGRGFVDHELVTVIVRYACENLMIGEAKRSGGAGGRRLLRGDALPAERVTDGS